MLAAFPASALGAVSADVSGSALTVFGDGGDNVITVSRVVAGKYRVEAEQAVTENSAECTVIGDDVECDVGPNPTLSMVGDAGDDLLTGAEGTVDTLYGQVGDDTLDGGLGVNALLGGEDADTFLGTSSANDTIFYASEGFTRTDGIDVTVNNGEADDGSAEDANVDGDTRTKSGRGSSS